MVLLRVAVLALSCLLLTGQSYAAAPTPQPRPMATSAPSPAPTPRFGDEIAVRLVTVVVRVVDGAGNPVVALAPGDFRVRVGRHEVPVTAVDWVAGGEPVAPAAEPAAPAPTSGPGVPAAGEPPSPPPAAKPSPARAAEPAAPAPAATPPGKLMVIFVQADANAPSRTRGHLHTLPFVRELLAALAPEDSVAVVAFASHLELWLDFTRDRAPVPEAIYQGIRFGARPPAPAGGGSPSLARSFDIDAARRAASPERALAVTADALAALPGEKVLVFLAWGLGSFSVMGTRMTPAFAPAVRALAAARTTVFVLDVTEADYHSLEIGLRGVADATGGTYDKTNVFPALAVRRLARTIAGYYVLSLDAAALPAGGGEVAVELRGRKGNVLLRPTSLPAAPAAPVGASR
jgi:VWFA-related protein